MRVCVTKHFGDRVLFDGFDFSVEEGSIVRLTGPSGRGKTTLLRIISGLEENEDKSPSDFSGHSFAWVFQEDRLTSSAGAYSNIALALGRSVDRRTILSERLPLPVVKKKFLLIHKSIWMLSGRNFPL